MSSYKSIPVEGGTMQAYVAMPSVLPAPAVIVIQEIFGVNGEIRNRCDDYASKGYIAIAPDMFWRIEPGVDITDQSKEEWDKAFSLMNAFDAQQGVKDLDATLAYARSLKDCTGKVGDIGFCLGGKLAYMMAARTNVDASISYYGVGLQEMLAEMQNIKSPTILHIAGKDKFSTPEATKEVVAEAEEHEMVTTYVYPEDDHAFARVGGDHYNANSARIALERSFAMFDKVLKG